MPKTLLLMFDLDGTLTDSMGVDSEAFAAALRQWLGTPEVDENWAAYRQHSDCGIAIEAFERHFGRAPLDTELQEFQAVYASALESCLRAAPDRCQPLPGAISLVATLEGHRDIAAGIATGSFERAARDKIRTAKLQVDHWPRATSDDAPARVDFMKICLGRAEAANGQRFKRVVYVGDGVWDANACRQLGWPMIGIAQDTHAGALTSAGAAVVFPHYPEPQKFLEAVWSAA
jgi:phosphoglycolate phosphatase-like HAD superfamily hydrolase